MKKQINIIFGAIVCLVVCVGGLSYHFIGNNKMLPEKSASKNLSQNVRYKSTSESNPENNPPKEKVESTVNQRVNHSSESRSMSQNTKGVIESNLRSFQIKGTVTSDLGRPLHGLVISCAGRIVRSSTNGLFTLTIEQKQKDKIEDLNIVSPSRTYYRRVPSDVISFSKDGAVKLNKIEIPSANMESKVSGTVVGDSKLVPRFLRLESVDGLIVGVIPVKANGSFEGGKYPNGDYYLMNASNLGVSLPEGAKLRKYSVSIKDTDAQHELVFHVGTAK